VPDLEDIVQRIALAGSDDVIASFGRIGEAGVQAFKQLAEAAGPVGKVLGGAAGALAGLVGGSFLWAERSSQAAHSLEILSKQSGESVESISSLQTALSAMGGGAANMQGMFRRMGNAITEAWSQVKIDVTNAADVQIKDTLSVEKAEENLFSVRQKHLKLLNETGDIAHQLATPEQERLEKRKKSQTELSEAEESLRVAEKKRRDDQRNSEPAYAKAIKDITEGTKNAAEAGKEANLSVENITKGLVANAPGAEEALKKFNGTLESIQGFGPQVTDILFRLADFLKNSGNAALNSAVQMHLFGRTVGTEMVVPLSQGSEALKEYQKRMEEFGLVITDKMTKAGTEFHQAFNRLSSALSITTEQIGLMFAPTFTEQMQTFTKYIEENHEAIMSWATDMVAQVKPIIIGFFDALKGLVGAMTGIDVGGGNAEKWKNTWIEVGRVIKTVADGIMSAINGIKSVIDSLLGTDISKITAGLIGLVGWAALGGTAGTLFVGGFLAALGGMFGPGGAIAAMFAPTALKALFGGGAPAATAGAATGAVEGAVAGAAGATAAGAMAKVGAKAGAKEFIVDEEGNLLRRVSGTFGTTEGVGSVVAGQGASGMRRIATATVIGEAVETEAAATGLLARASTALRGGVGATEAALAGGGALAAGGAAGMGFLSTAIVTAIVLTVLDVGLETAIAAVQKAMKKPEEREPETAAEAERQAQARLGLRVTQPTTVVTPREQAFETPYLGEGESVPPLSGEQYEEEQRKRRDEQRKIREADYANTKARTEELVVEMRKRAGPEVEAQLLALPEKEREAREAPMRRRAEAQAREELAARVQPGEAGYRQAYSLADVRAPLTRAQESKALDLVMKSEEEVANKRRTEALTIEQATEQVRAEAEASKQVETKKKEAAKKEEEGPKPGVPLSLPIDLTRPSATGGPINMVFKQIEEDRKKAEAEAKAPHIERPFTQAQFDAELRRQGVPLVPPSQAPPPPAGQPTLETSKIPDVSASLGKIPAPADATSASLQKLQTEVDKTTGKLGQLNQQAAPAPARGGMLGPGVEQAGGGHVRGFGSGTSDDVPAMLSVGEYVVRADGSNLGEAISHFRPHAWGGLIARGDYAKGGEVEVALANSTNLNQAWSSYAVGGDVKSTTQSQNTISEQASKQSSISTQNITGGDSNVDTASFAAGGDVKNITSSTNINARQFTAGGAVTGDGATSINAPTTFAEGGEIGGDTTSTTATDSTTASNQTTNVSAGQYFATGGPVSGDTDKTIIQHFAGGGVVNVRGGDVSTRMEANAVSHQQPEKQSQQKASDGSPERQGDLSVRHTAAAPNITQEGSQTHFSTGGPISIDSSSSDTQHFAAGGTVIDASRSETRGVTTQQGGDTTNINAPRFATGGIVGGDTVIGGVSRISSEQSFASGGSVGDRGTFDVRDRHGSTRQPSVLIRPDTDSSSHVTNTQQDGDTTNINAPHFAAGGVVGGDVTSNSINEHFATGGSVGDSIIIHTSPFAGDGQIAKDTRNPNAGEADSQAAPGASAGGLVDHIIRNYVTGGLVNNLVSSRFAQSFSDGGRVGISNLSSIVQHFARGGPVSNAVGSTVSNLANYFGSIAQTFSSGGSVDSSDQTINYAAASDRRSGGGALPTLGGLPRERASSPEPAIVGSAIAEMFNGGLVGGLSETMQPSSNNMSVGIGGSSAGSAPQGHPVNIVIDGNTFSGFTAPPHAIDQVQNYAVDRKLRSGGSKPSWYR